MSDDVTTKIGVGFDVDDAIRGIRTLQTEIIKLNDTASHITSGDIEFVKKYQKGLMDSLAVSKQFSVTTGIAKSSVQNFADSLERGKMSFGEYFKYGIASSKNFTKSFMKEQKTVTDYAESRVKALQTQYVSLGKAFDGSSKVMMAMPKSLNALASGSALATQRTQIFNKVLEQGTTHLINWGKNTQWAGRQTMVGFTLPLLVAASKAKTIFADLEKESMRFRRVYGDMFTAPEQTEKALKDIRMLAKEMTRYGVTVAETTRMAADAAAAGKQGAELRSAVAEAVKLSVLGEVEQQEALRTTIALQNAYKISATELAGAVNYLNAVENQSVLSISDITEAIPRLGPVVQQLGGDIKDTTVFLTAMRESGISAEQGANALKSGLASLINPTGRAKEALAKFGINIEKIVKDNEGNLMGMVTEFATAMNNLSGLEKTQTLEKVFGKFQYARVGALLDNIVTKGSQANQVLELAQTSALSLAALSQKELFAIETSPITKLQAAFENLRNVFMPIGKQVTESLGNLLGMVQKVADWFTGLPEPVKEAAAVFGKLFATIGTVFPVVVMGVGLFANFAGNLLKVGKSGTSAIRSIFGIGKNTKFLSDAQIAAIAAANSLEGATHSLTSQMLMQDSAVQALNRSLAEYAMLLSKVGGAAGTMAAKVPTIMTSVRSVPGALVGKGVRRFSRGGTVPGTGRGDTVPALLEPKEIVMNRQASTRFGGILAAMNAGKLKMFSGGSTVYGGSERSHLTVGLPTTIDSLLTKFGSIMERTLKKNLEILAKQKDVAAKLTLLSNLVVELPATVNQRLRDGKTMPNRAFQPQQFANVWEQMGPRKWDVAVKTAGMSFADVEKHLKQFDAEIVKLMRSMPDDFLIHDDSLPKLIDQAFNEVIRSASAVDKEFEATLVSLKRLGTQFNNVRIGGITSKDMPGLQAAGFTARPGSTNAIGNPERGTSMRSYKVYPNYFKEIGMEKQANGGLAIIQMVEKAGNETIADLNKIRQSTISAQHAIFNKVQAVVNNIGADMQREIDKATAQVDQVASKWQNKSAYVAKNRAQRRATRNDGVYFNELTNATSKSASQVLNTGTVQIKAAFTAVEQSAFQAAAANQAEARASAQAAQADAKEAVASDVAAKQSRLPNILRPSGSNGYDMFKLTMATDAAAVGLMSIGGKAGEVGQKLFAMSTGLSAVSMAFGAFKTIAGDTFASKLTGFIGGLPPTVKVLVAGAAAAGAAFYLLTRKTQSAAEKLEAEGTRMGLALGRSSNAVEQLFLNANVARRGSNVKPSLAGTSFEGQDNIFDAFKIDASFKSFNDALAEGAGEIFKVMNMFKVSEADLKVVLDSMSQSIGQQQGRSASAVRTELIGKLSKLLAPDGSDMLKDPLKITAELTVLGNQVGSDDKLKTIKQQIEEIDKAVEASNKKQKVSAQELSKAENERRRALTELRVVGGSVAMFKEEKSGVLTLRKEFGELSNLLPAIREKLEAYNRAVTKYNQVKQAVIAPSMDKALLDEKRIDMLKSIQGQQAQLNQLYIDGAIDTEKYTEITKKLTPMYEQLVKEHNKYITSLSKTGLKDFTKNLEEQLKDMKIEFGDGSDVKGAIESLQQSIFKGKNSEKLKQAVYQAFVSGLESDRITNAADQLFKRMDASMLAIFNKTPTLLNNMFSKMSIDPTFEGDFLGLIQAMQDGKLDAASLDVITKFVLDGKAMGPLFEKLLKYTNPEVVLKIKAVMDGPSSPKGPGDMFKNFIGGLKSFAQGWGEDVGKQFEFMTAAAELGIEKLEKRMKARLEQADKDVAAKSSSVFSAAFKKYAGLSKLPGIEDLGGSFKVAVAGKFYTFGKDVDGVKDGVTKLNERLTELAAIKIPIDEEIDKASKSIEKLNKDLATSVDKLNNVFEYGTKWKQFGDKAKATLNSFAKMDLTKGRATSPIATPTKETTFEFKAPNVPKLNIEDMVNWKPVGAAKFVEAFKLPPEIIQKAKDYIKIFNDAEKVGGIGAGIKAWEAIGEEVAKTKQQVEDFADAVQIAAEVETKAVEAKYEKLGKTLEKNWFAVSTELSNLGDGEVQAAFNKLYNDTSAIFANMQGSFENAAKAIADAADASAKEVEARYKGAAEAIEKYFDDQITALNDSFSAWEKQAGRDWDAATTQMERDWDDATAQIEAGYDAIREAADKSYDAQVAAANDAFDAQVEAAKEAHDAEIALIEKAQNAEQKALQKSQRAESKAFDKAQNKRRKAKQKEFDAARDALEAQFDAEIKAAQASGQTGSGDDGKQAAIDAINEAYDLQLEALAKISDYEKFITDQKKSQVDLASALASGDIASAAKITADMQQRESEFQSGATEKSIQDAKEAALKAIEDEFQARNDAQDTSNDAAIEAINARKDLAIQALQDQQDAEMEALDDQMDAESEALGDRQDEEMEALRERQEAELDAIRKRQEAQIKAMQDAHDKEMEAASAAHDAAMAAMEAEHQSKMQARSRQHEDDMQRRSLAHEDEMDKIRLAHEAKITALENDKETQLAGLEEAKTKELDNIATIETKRNDDLKLLETAIKESLDRRKDKELETIKTAYDAIMGPAGPVKGYEEVEQRVKNVQAAAEAHNKFLVENLNKTVDEQVKKYEDLKAKAEARQEAVAKEETSIKNILQAISDGQEDVKNMSERTIAMAEKINDIDQKKIDSLNALKDAVNPDSPLNKFLELQAGNFPSLPSDWLALLNAAGVDITSSGTGGSAMGGAAAGNAITAISNSATGAGRIINGNQEGDSDSKAPTSLPTSSGGSSLKSRFIGGAASLLPQSHDGLNSTFREKVANLLSNFPGVKIHSAFRPVWYQQQLWDKALKKYGSVAAARKWVAPPGKSMHGSGLALDLSYPRGEGPAVRAAAGRYGLKFPMSWEPWHIEDSSTRGGGPAPADDGSDLDSQDTGPQYTAQDLAKGMIQALLTGKFPELATIQGNALANGASSASTGAFIGPVAPGDVTGNRTGGSVSWRGNNPGNIRPGAFATSMGAVGVIHTEKYGDFAKFPNYQTGWNAMRALLLGNAYRNLSIVDAIFKWAPPADHNNSASYAAAVAKAVGAPAGTKVGQLTPQQLLAMMEKIKQTEGWIPGVQQAANGAFVEASHGGSLFQVGEGGKDEIISPVDKMYETVRRALMNSFGAIGSLFSNGKSGGSDDLEVIKQKLLELDQEQLKQKLEDIEKSKALIEEKIKEAVASDKSQREVDQLTKDLHELHLMSDQATGASLRNREAIVASIEQLKLNIKETYRSTMTTAENTMLKQNDSMSTLMSTDATDMNTASVDLNTYSLDGLTYAADGSAFALDAVGATMTELATKVGLTGAALDTFVGQVQALVAEANSAAGQAQAAAMFNPANPGGLPGYTGTSGPPGTPSTTATRAQQWWINHGNTSDPSTQLNQDPAQWGLTWDDINAAANRPPGQTAGPNMTGQPYPVPNIIIPVGESPIPQLPATFDWTAMLLASGGIVPKYFAHGGPSGSDTVPAWLTPGEFVVKKPVVDKYGDLLHAMNSDIIPSINSYDAALKPSSVNVSGGNVYNIQVNAQTNANPDDISYAVRREINRVASRPVRSYGS